MRIEHDLEVRRTLWRATLQTDEDLNHKTTGMTTQGEVFDCIIVGGGTAGVAVASRFS